MNANGSKWIRPEKRLAIYLRDEMTCQYCNMDLRHCQEAMRTLDHLIPRCYKGSNHQSNLVLACRICNDARGDILLQSWAPHLLDHIKQQTIKPLDMKRAKELLALKKIVQGAA